MANEPTVQNLDQTPAQTPEKKPKTSAAHKTLTVIGIILCVILIPMLIANIALIVKSYTGDENTPPSLFNVTPMIVLTDSMSPTINGGDLIFATKVDPTTIKEGDIISFFDPASKTGALLTHRVIEVFTDKDGKLLFKTKGDFNNAEDKMAVYADKVIGVYAFRIPFMGSVAMFMQTTVGLIVCVVVPLLILIAYDVIRRKKYEKSKKQDTDALLKELEELRAAQAAAPVSEAAPAESAPAEEAPAEETPAE
ncbi:MAG: signal peptidase I [Clostridia bacterium]|nr:signal peptidase I [Clostridia bacterium]